ncbi:AbrB family transcriptional regulator [Roseovarius sp. A21]|uniref:AbrB family transcriptional regulator n=1 Tax=Roseovarius bejariae TaxID=2576383 RepID=A0A844CPT2_9RHOB|nr:AbrB family transcriptional regulator [Roseovarius bejariae]MRU13959.1 AbrB family transcriptional regulator [Roseovarius bejariae]
MPHLLTTLALLGLGTLAAFAVRALGLPLPFLMGPLLLSGTVAMALPAHLPDGYRFPQWLRLAFIAVIGLMIGAQVTPELFRQIPRLILSLAALTLFVGVAHAFNYAVFRRLGAYDRATAFYAATPGGLFESIAMGEEAGADLARLTLQQFLRVIVVVTTLPLGLSLWLGEPVGSAGGMTLARDAVPWQAIPGIALAGLLGLGLGRVLHLPAKQLTGPMAVAALLSLTGAYPLDIPQWLVNVAQVVVGTALGMRFTGLSRALILRGAGLSLVSVAGMLILAAICAEALHLILGEPFDVLFISFAPGGVTEMALVALSLQANPALVTLHHIWRILVTVLGLTLTRRWLRRFL